MSRRATPTKLKLLKGTAQKCRINPKEPKPKNDKIKAPDHLSKDASKHWDTVVEQLTAAGIMTNLDNAALGMYCESYAKYVDANKKIHKLGTIIKAPSGYPIPSPYLSIACKAFEEMRKMLVEFGMTPSSRAGIQSSKPKQKRNEFEDF